MREIYLVRHGETESNVAAIWEGFGDSALTRRGRLQVEALSTRLGGVRFDVVAASDLGRAAATADAVAPGRVETDPAWREADLGSWEGATTAEVLARDPGTLQALGAGEDVPMGGGESPGALAARARAAFHGLLDRLDDGGRALVVTHGGVVTALVSAVLGVDRDHFGVVGGVVNTAVTRIRSGDRGIRVDVFNDAAHVGDDHLGYGPPGTHVLLIRHGETEANRSGIWQGRTDGSMTEEGHRQAGLVAAVIPPLTGLYASSLSRARLTAAAIGAFQGIEPVVREDLVEIAMGAWEGLSPDEISRRYPAEWKTLIEEHDDLPRGGDGETFGAVAARMAAAVEGIAAEHNGGPVGVVSHGGAIRAYVSGLVGLGFAGRRRLASPDNTSVSRVVLGGRRPRLAAYNVSAHLV